MPSAIVPHNGVYLQALLNSDSLNNVPLQGMESEFKGAALTLSDTLHMLLARKASGLTRARTTIFCVW